MKAKMPFPASNGQTSRFWRTGDAICQGSVLPKLPICTRTNPARLVIRWMSVQGQPRGRSHRVARSLRGLIAGGSGQATNWLWTYNNDRSNMGLGRITPAQKLKLQMETQTAA